MNSFISWIGGKHYLKNTITARMPAGINRYIEVFGGAGWVLFNRDRHAEYEVYNDCNSELTNLFRCVKYHGAELQRELTWVLNSREVFKDYMQAPAAGLTDIQRAARFFYILKVSYGSNGRSYGGVKKDMVSVYDYLSRVQNRLSSVVIENRDFESLLQVYDRTDAFFYLDPPYFGTEKYYQVQFSEVDHQRLATALRSIKGRWLLSYNDCEYVRELYADYQIEPIERQHNMKARYGNHRYQELLISNYS